MRLRFALNNTINDWAPTLLGGGCNYNPIRRNLGQIIHLDQVMYGNWAGGKTINQSGDSRQQPDQSQDSVGPAGLVVGGRVKGVNAMTKIIQNYVL